MQRIAFFVSVLLPAADRGRPAPATNVTVQHARHRRRRTGATEDATFGCRSALQVGGGLKRRRPRRSTHHLTGKTGCRRSSMHNHLS